MRYGFASVAVARAIALSGCVSMAPHYARPDAPVPSVIGSTGSTGNADTGTPNAAALDWR
ncbi:hypothetical protein XACJK2_170018 [Xanthomonas citri pv. citri]|nr:hypothetical protein XACJK2_170018 [Xanthomonas citri pv. citri]